MTDRKISPIRRPTALAEVGGIVDESSATLAVYGETLEPEEITSILGVAPTSSFRRGHKRGPRSPAMPHGAWFIEVRGTAPDGPESQLLNLLAQLPQSSDIWHQLTQRFQVQVRVALHLEGWNRGFAIDKALLTRLAQMGIDLQFDIYEYGGADA